MTDDAEQLLASAVQDHSQRRFKEGAEKAERAQRMFQATGLKERATEAYRVRADCVLNARELKDAEKIYTKLLEEARASKSIRFQAAANWGLGQIAFHRLEYGSASRSFSTGLRQAQRVKDKWFTAWDAFGLANAYRGTGRLDEARELYREAISSFEVQNQQDLASWARKALEEIESDVPEPDSEEYQVYLCPLCGSKLTSHQARASGRESLQFVPTAELQLDRLRYDEELLPPIYFQADAVTPISKMI